MNEQQAQMPSQVIYVEGLGFIPIKSGQTPQQAIADAQTKKSGVGMERDPNALAVQGPGDKQVGFQMPEGAGGEQFGSAMTSLLSAFPQAAGLIAQFMPGVRAFGLAGSMGIPAAARVASNTIEGKPLTEGVARDAAWGGVAHIPQAIGTAAKAAAPNIMRHALFSQTPLDDISRTAEDFLPKKALQLRAAPTTEGVAKMKGLADNAMHQGTDLGPYRELEQLLEGVRKHQNVRGSGSGVTAIMPGSGIVTTGVRATGLPAAAGQIAAPIAGAIKGSPTRRMAIARNLDRPGNIASSDDIGLAIAQMLRALAAQSQSQLQPVASHEPTAPRRRQQ